MPPTTTKAFVALPDGTCLLTSDEGLRIQTTKVDKGPGGSVVCRGQMSAAPEVAPEALVGMVQRKDSWLFVGESGNLYESEKPLDSFRRVIGAPTTFGRVVGNGNTILAATLSGELFRLEEPSTWQAVKMPVAAHVYDLAVASDGSSLALALPEKLFASSDGQTFREASTGGTIGARRLGQAAGGALSVQGVLGTMIWDPSKSPPLMRTTEPVLPRTSTLDVEASTLPTASAVVEGRAVLDGDRYVEAVLVEEETGTWGLAIGSLEGPLATTRLKGTTDCTAMRVGARGRHVTTVCTRSESEGGQTAHVRMSHDGGATFGQAVEFFAGDGDLLHVAVANDGSALLTGACKPRTGSSGCFGSPPILFREENGSLTSTFAVSPALMGLPISPAYSVDGKSAYFLARRAKDEKLALFVSHDGGRTFAERSLDAPSKRPRADGEEPSESSEESFDPSDLTTVRASDDGTLGMVLTTSHGLSYLTTDDDGHVLGMSQPPVEQALIGGYGRRVLAISSASTSDPTAPEPSVTAWESEDGGATWNEISVTRSVVREIVTGPLTVTCAHAGCLVGATITRIGWSGQTDAPSIARPKGLDAQKTKAVRTPLVCTLDAKTPWKRLDHVWSGPPTLSATARGRTMWSVLSYDTETSALATTFATLPERGDGPARVTTRTMFAPAPKGAEYAVDASLQVEGYAAARVRLPEGDRPLGAMRNMEVAWENFIDGTSKQTTIPDAGMFLDGDIKRDDGRRFLDTALMSVTSGAIFVQPHSRNASDKRLLLLDTKGKRSPISFPPWESLVPSGKTNLHGDTALAEGKPLAVGTIDQFEGDASGPITMLLAPPVENLSSKAIATSLFPPTTDDHVRVLSHDLAYRGPSEVGMVGISSEPRAGRATAMFLPFRADGSFGQTVEIPTPFDLPDNPRPCKADERRSTPRLAAHAITGPDLMFPGTRHPVFISEAQNEKAPLSDTIVMLTWGAIVQGTKEAPCVAAWEVFGLASTGMVAVIDGDPSRGWLFRQVQNLPPEPGLHLDRTQLRRDELTFEHRPMSCHFDASAPIPEIVWSQPGTFRWTTK